MIRVVVTPVSAPGALNPSGIKATVYLGGPGPAGVAGAAGADGPAGAAGPPGPAGGSVITRNAAGAVSGHRAVIAVSGGCSHASADRPEDARLILGVSKNAASSGAAVDIQVSEEITESSWSWSTGPVFLGLNGLLVQPAPIGVAFVRQIGVALSATRLLVTPLPPIKTL